MTDLFTTKGTRGTVLGHPIVYESVERQQGTISAGSAPGHGTTASVSPPAGVATPALNRPAHAQTAGLRILAVDDERSITQMIRMMLRPQGHAITSAATGEEALAIIDAARKPFDVILSDLGLGDGISGWDLLAEVRTRAPESRFILSTGWGAQIDPSEVVARGGAGLLPKPYRLAELLAAIAGPD